MRPHKWFLQRAILRRVAWAIPRPAGPPPPEEEPKLLAAGTPAPEFTAEAWGGKPLKLSDLKGKVVVLDFWATWCGPCQRSMPHLEQVHQAVKDQGVVVLGVCVLDDRKAYDAWVPVNREKYSFPLAFDPAGRDSSRSIARSLYNVSGIPATYIIDREGKVAAAFSGYSPGDVRIEEALQKLGVRIGGSKPAE